MLNTTAFSLSGHTIVAELGTVRGIVVRSRSVIGNFGASIQTLFGGDITLYTELCERARKDAFDRMCQHATDIAAGVTEVLCYGTAVQVAANSVPPPLG